MRLSEEMDCIEGGNERRVEFEASLQEAENWILRVRALEAEVATLRADNEQIAFAAQATNKTNGKRIVALEGEIEPVIADYRSRAVECRSIGDPKSGRWWDGQADRLERALGGDDE